MDNTVTAVDSGPLSDQLQRVVLGSHAKLERQGSKGSRGCPTPSRQVVTPLGNRVDSEKQTDDLHGLLGIVSRRLNVSTLLWNKQQLLPALPAWEWLAYLTMFHHIRTLASNRGGRSQSGGLGRRRTTTAPSQRGVGSRTKEASGTPSRNCSRRSKNTDMCTRLSPQ